MDLQSLDIWKLLAGLGLFLFGMNGLESSLKNLAGRRFKLFLRDHTKNRWSAIVNGALVTALLQSSSIVLLMIIAFAGAGILSLSNSLGIILGANLGTTITGWIVSYLGFKTNIEAAVFPLIALGSAGLMFVNSRAAIHHLFSFSVSLGLMLMGLGFMKEGVRLVASDLSPEFLTETSWWGFFFFGFCITALIHSSSGMMMITLSALHAGLLPLSSAAFIAIGADLGTTITALLVSQKGNAVKKRVGLAHFLFNVGTGVVALVFAHPLLEFVGSTLGIRDPLFALVAFHSSFNFLGIFMFVPFLGAFETFLNTLFRNSNDHACHFIHKVGTEVPDAALEAIRQEMHHFLNEVLEFNRSVLGMPLADSKMGPMEGLRFLRDFIAEKDPITHYEVIKRSEGELLDYFVSLHKESLDPKESKSLQKSITALRNGVQSAKAAKDIYHNLHEFRQSVSDVALRLNLEIAKEYLRPLQRLTAAIEDRKNLAASEWTELQNLIEEAYLKLNAWIYSTGLESSESPEQVATFLNVNREIASSLRLLSEAALEVQQMTQLAFGQSETVTKSPVKN